VGIESFEFGPSKEEELDVRDNRRQEPRGGVGG
jgi:hypothetical protein